MATRLLDPEEIRKLPTTGARARAIRAYFQTEKDMRALRDEVIRELRAEGASIAETAKEVDCSIATVKTATRGQGLETAVDQLYNLTGADRGDLRKAVVEINRRHDEQGGERLEVVRRVAAELSVAYVGGARPAWLDDDRKGELSGDV